MHELEVKCLISGEWTRSNSQLKLNCESKFYYKDRECDFENYEALVHTDYWRTTANGTFLFVPENLTFHEAAQHCKKAGGRLFEPEYEDVVFQDIFQTPPVYGTFWTGIHNFEKM